MASSSQAFSIIKLARNQVTRNAQAARDNEALRLAFLKLTPESFSIKSELKIEEKNDMRVSGDSFSGATCLKRVDNAIHQLNLYPMDNAVAFSDTCPLYSAMLLVVTDKR